MKAAPALFLLAVPAAFAAGWFLRPVPARSGAEAANGYSKTRPAMVSDSLAGKSAAKKSSALESPPPVVITPLTSLKEILAMLGPDGSFEDESSAAVIMMELLPRLMITDAATVQAMVEELSGTEGLGIEGKKILTMGLMFRWMTVQPETAVGYALAHPDVMENNKEMTMMGLVYMAKSRPEAAKAMAALLPEDAQDEAREFLAQLEGTTDPAGVLKDPDKLAALDDGQAAKFAARWMRTDPAAATAWFEALPPEKRTPALTARIAAGRMAQDPVAAIAWVNALPDGPEKSASRQSMIARALDGVGDKAGMESKLTTLPPDWQDEVRLQWLSGQTPAKAAESADQLKSVLVRNPALAGEDKTKRILNTIAQSYSNGNNFTEGVQWAAGLPEGPAQVAAVSHLASNWTARDPTAASTWITSLPTGPLRDGAAMSMINQIQRDDPGSALVWAQSLSTEPARDQQTRGVFQAWFRKQPLEAINAIQALPPAEQQRILSKP